MTRQPTYTATQIKEMCSHMDLDHEGFKILADLIDEEIDLYPVEDIPILMAASMLSFTRSMFKISLKRLE